MHSFTFYFSGKAFTLLSKIQVQYIFESSSTQIDTHTQYYWDCLSLGMKITSLRRSVSEWLDLLLLLTITLLTDFQVLHFAYCSAFGAVEWATQCL